MSLLTLMRVLLVHRTSITDAVVVHLFISCQCGQAIGGCLQILQTLTLRLEDDIKASWLCGWAWWLHLQKIKLGKLTVLAV